MRSEKRLCGTTAFVAMLVVMSVFFVFACACGSVSAVRSVTLKKDGVAVGETLTVDLSAKTVKLEAVVDKDEGASGTLVFVSSKAAVATVDNEGNVTLKTAGETTVTATFGNKSASVLLKVEGAQAAVKYNVIVSGGTADKTTAAEGETVTLTPGTPPKGKAFSAWKINDVVIDGNSFAMPGKKTTAVAVFDFVDYTITVTGGTADKTTAHYGDTVTLTANTVPADKEFRHWMVNDETVTGNTFVMPAGNVNVQAVLKDKPAVTEYKITVTGGSADKATAAAGATITLTPNSAETGKEFKRWVINGAPQTGNTFEMPAEDVTAVAVFEFIEYRVQVTGGTADKTTAHYGDTVTLTPGSAEIGKEFKKWIVNGVDRTENTIAMPAEDVNVTAVFDFADYTITVTGGTADKTTAHYGDTVTLTLTQAEIPSGKEFLRWTINNREIEGNAFAMPAENVTVKAEYKDIGAATTYSVTVTGGTASAASAEAGADITLTPGVPPAGLTFNKWQVNGSPIEGNTFKMPAAQAIVVATYFKPFETPDNSDDRLFYQNTVGGAVEIDRKKSPATTLFIDEVDYVKVYVYTAADADKNEYAGVLKLHYNDKNANIPSGKIEVVGDPSKYLWLIGDKGNVYFTENSRLSAFNAILAASVRGFEYNKRYYFALQLILKDSARITETDGNGNIVTYADSGITSIGEKGYMVNEYGITVIGGTADKLAAFADAVVTLTPAEPPSEDKVFSHWMIDGVRYIENTFTMPAKNITVTAEYKDKPQEGVSYTVTVEGGAADKATAQEGDLIKLTPNAAAEGFEFHYWDVNGRKVIPGADGAVAMPAEDTLFKAVFIQVRYDLELPTTNADGILFDPKSSNLIEFDRYKEGDKDASMFDDNTKHVLVYVYASASDANTAQASLGSFKLEYRNRNEGAWFLTLDGAIVARAHGKVGNDWLTSDEAIAQFNEILKAVTGEAYIEGATFYFAVRKIGLDNTEVDGHSVEYNDSAISAIGPHGYTVVRKFMPAD